MGWEGHPSLSQALGGPAEQPPLYSWRKWAPRDRTIAVNKPELPSFSLARLAASAGTRGNSFQDTRHTRLPPMPLEDAHCPGSPGTSPPVPTREGSQRSWGTVWPSQVSYNWVLQNRHGALEPWTIRATALVRGRTEHNRSTATPSVPGARGERAGKTTPGTGLSLGAFGVVRVRGHRHVSLLCPGPSLGPANSLSGSRGAMPQSLMQVWGAGDPCWSVPVRDRPSPTGVCTCVHMCARAGLAEGLRMRTVSSSVRHLPPHLTHTCPAVGSGPEVCACGTRAVPRTTRRLGSCLSLPAPRPRLSCLESTRWS